MEGFVSNFAGPVGLRWKVEVDPLPPVAGFWLALNSVLGARWEPGFPEAPPAGVEKLLPVEGFVSNFAGPVELRWKVEVDPLPPDAGFWLALNSVLGPRWEPEAGPRPTGEGF